MHGNMCQELILICKQDATINKQVQLFNFSDDFVDQNVSSARGDYWIEVSSGM